MPAGRRQARGMALGVALLVLAVGRLAAGAGGWIEDFRLGRLDASRWELTHDGDFRSWSADVVEARPSGSGYRLRLTADTRGTRDDTLKHLGVRAIQPMPLREGTRIAVRLDRGEPANGSYLTAAVVLSPHATRGDPLRTPDWLKVAYVGVPPGRNARMLVALRAGGRERTVYTEGWPDANPGGRPVGVQTVVVQVSNRSVEVWEAERRIWQSRPDEIATANAYLYLQISSHSNYPARSIYFEHVEVQP